MNGLYESLAAKYGEEEARNILEKMSSSARIGEADKALRDVAQQASEKEAAYKELFSKQLAQDAVDSKAIPGKTAADSAKVFTEEMGTNLPMKTTMPSTYVRGNRIPIGDLPPIEAGSIGLPAVQGSKELATINKLGPGAERVIEAEVVPAWKVAGRKLLKSPYAKAALAASAAGAAYLGLGDEEVQADKLPPSVPSSIPLSESSSPISPIAQDIPKNIPQQEALPPSAVEAELMRQLRASKSANSAIPKEIDFGDNTQAQMVNLQSAQDASNLNRLYANLGASFNTISAGLGQAGGGAKVVADNSGFKALAEQADAPLKNYKERVENEENDPNSAASKGMKELVEKTTGIKVNGSASAAFLKKQFPQLVSLYNDQQDRQSKMDLLKLKLAESRDEKLMKKNEEPLKEKLQIQKENRAVRRDLDSAEKTLETQIKDLTDAKTSFESYSKKSVTGGTGPIATLGGLTKVASQPTELLDSKFKKLSFDELTKTFKGMSKAIDSDAERRSFESTQPSITLDDQTNRTILEDKLAAAKRLLEKTRQAKTQYDRTGDFTQPEVAPARSMSSQVESAPAPKEQKNSMSSSHPQDEQALAWAKANPTDPRSAEILKHLGK